MKPSSSIAGMRLFGLIFRYSGVRSGVALHGQGPIRDGVLLAVEPGATA
jgi:hypothetical protein